MEKDDNAILAGSIHSFNVGFTYGLLKIHTIV